jgi:SET domain-containing protein
MASEVEVRTSPIHGVGVFATRSYGIGERILPIDDSRVVTEDAPLDPAKGEYDHHQDYLGTHDVLMQEPERYINHCCEPNVYVKAFDGVRWVVAYRKIEAGDEIAYDYCINSYGDEEWACECGHLRCRKVHNTDFFKLPEGKLVEYFPLLDDWFIEWRRDRVLELRERLATGDFVKPSY